MRNGRRPTRKEKFVIVRHRLVPKDWLVIKSFEGVLTVANKATSEIKILEI